MRQVQAIKRHLPDIRVILGIADDDIFGELVVVDDFVSFPNVVGRVKVPGHRVLRIVIRSSAY